MDDRAAVIDTVNRYARALDAREWASLDAVFTPDVEVDFGGAPVTGLDALRDMLCRMLGGPGPRQHLLGSHCVDLDGDRARCTCQVRTFAAGMGDAAARSYELVGEYHDELVRTPSGWRIARRVMRVHAELGDRSVLSS